MHSIKTKLSALGLACALALALAGCAFSTPATVGTIGEVEIPAGVYLLAQYNAYNTASGLAELATGESANDVKAVLKATCTGTIGNEEVTDTGKNYINRLTMRALQYYAAVETEFNARGLTLSDAATAEAASTADGLWETNEKLYAANGIGKQSVLTYLLNGQKAQAVFDARYGENGTEPVPEQEIADYLTNDCYYLQMVQIPLMDYSTYAYATDEQHDEIEKIAQECVEMLKAATGESAANAPTAAAMAYVPRAMEVLGATLSETEAMGYAGEQLYTADSLTGFESGETNPLTEALDAAGMDQWTTVDMGTVLLVVRRVETLADGRTADSLNEMYGIVEEMKSGALQDEFYEAGYALPSALTESALKTYSADKIKRTL